MSNTQPESDSNKKDVPLGPACFVVFLFFAVGFSVFIVYMSLMMMGNQGKRAAYSVRELLIPWVDQSTLDESDRISIVSQLTDLAESMEREELTKRQLSRLVVRLNNSVILQWSVVEAINRVAQASKELSEKEKSEFSDTCDRALRAASEGKISLMDIEFSLQKVCTKEAASGRLDLKKEISVEDLREVHRRLLTFCDQSKISREPFHKSVSQVFQMSIEDGLKEKE